MKSRSLMVTFLTIALAAPATRAATTEDGLLAQVLLEKKRATRADCLAVVASFRGYNGDLVDIDSVLEYLADHGIHDEPDAPRKGDRLTGGPLAEPATRGFACLLFQRALPQPDSLMSRIFANSEHYAYRYLQQRGAISGGGARSRISGDELVGLWRHCRPLMASGRGLQH